MYNVHEYAGKKTACFQHMRLLLNEGLVLRDIIAAALGRVTAKGLYERYTIFMIVNNIVPTRERLYMKMHMVDSPNCKLCAVQCDGGHQSHVY